AVAAHPIERVDAVELSPGVVDAAGFFRGTNHDVLADPRVQLTIADGRNFLLASHERWDVIRLDPPELHTAGVVSLYTREFYALARDHLAPFVLAGGGVAAFAGAGPVAGADSTRLDFTVPRSLDSFFGFANASSGGWLVDLMEPGARHDVGLAVFWRKLARMQTFERPVLPYLSGLAESGLTPEEVAARLAAAGAPVADVTNRRTTSAAAAAP